VAKERQRFEVGMFMSLPFVAVDTSRRRHTAPEVGAARKRKGYANAAGEKPFDYGRGRLLRPCNVITGFLNRAATQHMARPVTTIIYR